MLVSNYKYLGMLIDEFLSFTSHIPQLVKRLKLKLFFFFLLNKIL